MQLVHTSHGGDVAHADLRCLSVTVMPTGTVLLWLIADMDAILLRVGCRLVQC